MFGRANLFDWSAIRFLIVGSINTVVGLLTIFASKWLFDMSDPMANLIGYCVGVAVSFRLHTVYTFRYNGPQLLALFKYVVLVIVSYLINLGSVLAAIHALQINSYVAQVIGVIPYTLCMYFCSKTLIFVRPENSFGTRGK